MINLIPVLLIALGIWRFRVLSRLGVIEAIIGCFIMMACIIVATAFSLGVLLHATFS